MDSAPAIAVLAEGTAPVAIPYHAPPRRKTATVVALGAGAAILVAGIAIASSIKSRDTRAMTKRYPVAATAAEKTQLADRAAAWTRGKRAMLSTINGGLPALADLKGVGACTIVHARSTEELAIQPSSSLDDSDLAISTRMTVAAGHEREIVGMLSPSVDQLISSAQRARFRTPAGKAHVLAQLANAPLVIRVDQRREPELDREHDTVAPGVLAGTAYAFDPATGALRCAGSFRATSPAVPTLSRYAGLDAAEDAARADFALAVESAVVGSLRSID